MVFDLSQIFVLRMKAEICEYHSVHLVVMAMAWSKTKGQTEGIAS